MTTRRRLCVGLAGLAGLGACVEPELCEEDIRAQILDERVQVEIAGVHIEAELADDPVERERGWRHRTCEREALLLVPDTTPSELPVWGCGLVDAISVVFIADGQVQAIEALDPCSEPCTGCPSIGQDLLVEAVLELPATAEHAFGIGDLVSLSN